MRTILLAAGCADLFLGTTVAAQTDFVPPETALPPIPAREGLPGPQSDGCNRRCRPRAWAGAFTLGERRRGWIFQATGRRARTLPIRLEGGLGG